MSETEQKSYSIKLQFNEENRKVCVIDNYQGLIQCAYETFMLSPDSFNIVYIDDENDAISVSNQDDFIIALEFFNKTLPKFIIKLKPNQSLSNHKNNIIDESNDYFPNVKNCEDSIYENNDSFVNESNSKEDQFHSFDENQHQHENENFDNDDFGDFEEVKNESESYQEYGYLDRPIYENDPISLLNVHNGYQCDGCFTGPILGTRYSCIICEEFDLCEKCEQTLNHQHPLLKFKTNNDEEIFFINLQEKYIKSESKEEETKLFTPKVIDSSLNPPKYLEDMPEYFKPKGNDFTKFKSELVEMMPRTNYTIDLTTKTILLTISIKNTGVDEWPSGFYLGLLRTNDFKLEQRENDDKLIKYNPEINKQVKPNSVVVLNVQLYPPSTVGIFTYYLSLHTLSKVPFGDEIEFTFTVKNGVSPITYCGQYSAREIKPSYYPHVQNRPGFLKKVNQEFKKAKCKAKNAFRNVMSSSRY